MVRGTFSPARAWRPAVVYRLAQTLGTTQGIFGGPQSVHENQDPAARLALLQRSGKDRSASGRFRSTQWGTGLWPCPTGPASVARSVRNGSPTDEKYMRRSVLRTAAGQAAVAPSRCSSGGWRATAKGNSIALARVKSVQESFGISNPPWPRPLRRVVPCIATAVSSPGELPPQALSEPYVRLSPHTAPSVQPPRHPSDLACTHGSSHFWLT